MKYTVTATVSVEMEIPNEYLENKNAEENTHLAISEANWLMDTILNNFNADYEVESVVRLNENEKPIELVMFNR